jgi:hypothetical protein
VIKFLCRRSKRPKHKKSKAKKRKQSALSDKSTEFEEIFESSTDYDARSRSSIVQQLQIVPAATAARQFRMPPGGVPNEKGLESGTEVIPMSELEGLDSDITRSGPSKIVTSEDETSVSICSYCTLTDSKKILNSSQDETSASVSSYRVNGSRVLHSSQVSIHKTVNSDSESIRPSPNDENVNLSVSPAQNDIKVNIVTSTPAPKNKVLNVGKSPIRTDSVKGGQLTPRLHSTTSKGGSVTPSRLQGSATSSMLSHDSGMITMNPVSPTFNFHPSEDANNNKDAECTNIDSIFQEVFYGSDTCMSEDDAITIVGSSDKSNLISSDSLDDLGATDDIIVKPYAQNGGIVNPAFKNEADYNFVEEVTWL